MKRSVWTAMVFAMCSVGLVGGVPATASAQPLRDNAEAPRNAPPIVFEPGVCDLGIGKPGEELSRSITLRNTGTTPLKITRLKGSCSCTVPSVSSDVIAPGETAEMTVVMDPGWLPNKVRKQVSVFVEGFNRPATVPVVGEVSFAVRTEKPVVQVSVNDPVARVKIEAIDDSLFRVIRVNGKETDGRGQSVVSAEPQTSHEFEYAFGDEEIPTYLVIETDHADGPVVAVEMDHPDVAKRKRTHQLAGLKTDRHFMNLERVYPGETIELTLPVSGLAPQDVPQVSIEDERLEVRYMGKVPHAEKRAWFDVKLFVTIKDRDASGTINTLLKLEVPDSKQAVYSYVLGSIRPSSASAAKKNAQE